MLFASPILDVNYSTRKDLHRYVEQRSNNYKQYRVARKTRYFLYPESKFLQEFYMGGEG